jgi:hypothetical protein
MEVGAPDRFDAEQIDRQSRWVREGVKKPTSQDSALGIFDFRPADDACWLCFFGLGGKASFFELAAIFLMIRDRPGLLRIFRLL